MSLSCFSFLSNIGENSPSLNLPFLGLKRLCVAIPSLGQARGPHRFPLPLAPVKNWWMNLRFQSQLPSWVEMLAVGWAGSCPCCFPFALTPNQKYGKFFSHREGVHISLPSMIACGTLLGFSFQVMELSVVMAIFWDGKSSEFLWWGRCAHVFFILVRISSQYEATVKSKYFLLYQAVI